MNIFNSLGSNYDLKFTLRALFAQNKESYSKKLKEFLEKKYQGKAILVYKGREAIGLALEILELPKGSYVAINGFTCYAVYKAVIEGGYEAVCLDLEHKFPNHHSGDQTKPGTVWHLAKPETPESLRLRQGVRRFWTSQNDGLDLNFSANELSKALNQNPKIKAVIVQNTLGYPCDIEKIAKVCRENNLILIEDLAHSVGTVYKNGKEAGTIGDFVVLSFSQDKMIDAISGGALIIRNKKYQNRHSGNQAKPEHPESLYTRQGSVDVGDSGQARMTVVNAKQQLIDRLYPLFTFIIRKTYKLGLGKLIHFLLRNANLLSKPTNEGFYTKYNLPGWYAYLAMDAFANLNKNLKHRRKITNIYNSILDKKITSDCINKNITLSSNLRYPIFVENRKSLIKYLKNRGVYVSDIWYDDVDKNLPNSQTVADTILNLPTHKNVSENDARKIAQAINQFFRHSGDPHPIPSP